MNISPTGFGGFARPDFAQMRESMVKRADADQSGGINKAEFKASLAESPMGAPSSDQVESIFGQIDTDSDGEISSAEQAEGMKSFGPPQGGFGGLGAADDSKASALDSLLKALDESDAKSKHAQSSQPYMQQLLQQLRNQGTTATALSAHA